MSGVAIDRVSVAILIGCLVITFSVGARAIGPIGPDRLLAAKSQEDAEEVRASELTNRFWVQLKDELERAEVGMTSTGRSAAYKVIAKGARNLAESDATEEEVEKAENQLRKFALRLVEVAQNQRGDEATVDRGTVVRTKRGICPLFPFC